MFEEICKLLLARENLLKLLILKMENEKKVSEARVTNILMTSVSEVCKCDMLYQLHTYIYLKNNLK